MVGLYRGEFVKMIERAARDRSCLKFYITRFGRADTMTIVDFDLPRRAGFISPTQRETEWFHESQVCNVGVLEHSWVPFLGSDDEKRMYRGAKTAIDILWQHKCINKTYEINEFLRNPDLKLVNA